MSENNTDSVLKPENELKTFSEEHPLRQRLAEIRSKVFPSQDRIGRLVALSQSRLDLEEVETMDLPSINLLQQSAEYLLKIDKNNLRGDAVEKALETGSKTAELVEAWEAKRNYQANRISEKINSLNEEIWEKGLEGQPGALVLENQIDALRIERKKLREEAARYQNIGTPIRRFQEEVIENEVVREVQQVRGQYLQYMTELENSPNIIPQVREEYIDKCVVPLLSKWCKEYKIYQGREEEIVSSLKMASQIVLRNDLEAERELNELRQSLGENSLLWNGYLVLEWTTLVTKKSDISVLRRMVGSLFVEDIKKIAYESEGINLILSDFDREQIIATATGTKYKRLGRPGSRVSSNPETVKIEEISAEHIVKSPANLSFWEILQANSEVNAIFGDDQLEKIDEKIYQDALKSSLHAGSTVGGEIKLLAKYPTPETIRNLVLIASYGEYESSHKYNVSAVNTALNELSKRSDWQQIIDAAITKYPGLENNRKVLEGWILGGSDRIVSLGSRKAEEFAISILTNVEDRNPELLSLAAETLRTQTLADLLISRGTISQQEAASLFETDNKLLEIEKTMDAMRDGRPKLKGWVDIKSFYFQKLLRDKLLFMVVESEIGDRIGQKDALIRLQRVISLSAEIYENQQKLEILRYLTSQEVTNAIRNTEIELEGIFSIPKYAKSLLGEKMSEIWNFVFSNHGELMETTEDVKFLGRLIGEFGQKSDSIIRGYKECLDAGVIDQSERSLIIEFAKQFRVITPGIVEAYKQAKQNGSEKMFMVQLKGLAEKMTGEEIISEEERKKPFYKDLLRHVYAENASGWSSYTENEKCEDRSQDLAKYKIDPRYEIDLLSQAEIRVKDGQQLNLQVHENIQTPIYAVADQMKDFNYDKQKAMELLIVNLDETLAQIVEIGGLQSVNLAEVKTAEEKLFLVLSDSIYGTKSLDPEVIKSLIIKYEFAEFEDIADYIAGTRDRVGIANNPQYALLCELETFYADRIKEVHRRIVQFAWENKTIADAMPEYFKKLSEEASSSERQDEINRLQIDRLGLSDSFARQVVKILSSAEKIKKNMEVVPNRIPFFNVIIPAAQVLDDIANIDNEISRVQKNIGKAGAIKIVDERKEKIKQLEEDRNGLRKKKEELEIQWQEMRPSIDRIVDRYESFVDYLSNDKTESPKARTKAFYAQLRSQREKTLAAYKLITNGEIDSGTHLGEINLQEALNVEANIRSGKYDDEQFASYTAQRFIDIFELERLAIQDELEKFESLSGKQREVLYGYISKTKETANARMVGGVCVSGDEEMWNMPEYLQLVFKDPETAICQGLVLMHAYEENGQKLLSVSFNPSSTYLYSVDEEALFVGIIKKVEQFANNNDFDKILVSKNTAIRTNRTGGGFEKAIEKRISEVGKSYKFQTTKRFSYNPPYMIDDMDVLWEKNTSS